MTLRVQIWYTENILKQHIPYFVEVSTRGKQLPYPIFCRSKQKGQATPSVTVFFLIFCIFSLCDESVKRDLKDWDISEEVVLDRSAWRLAINVPEPWPVCLLGFISSLPQLAWDKRLCCCCCCIFSLSVVIASRTFEECNSQITWCSSVDVLVKQLIVFFYEKNNDTL